jgi:hypothetical protein
MATFDQNFRRELFGDSRPKVMDERQQCGFAGRNLTELRKRGKMSSLQAEITQLVMTVNQRQLAPSQPIQPKREISKRKPVLCKMCLLRVWFAIRAYRIVLKEQDSLHNVDHAGRPRGLLPPRSAEIQELNPRAVPRQDCKRELSRACSDQRNMVQKRASSPRSRLLDYTFEPVSGFG